MGFLPRPRGDAARVAALAIPAVLWLLVAACSDGGTTPPADTSGAMGSERSPILDLPSATLRATSGRSADGGKGTYCWSGPNYRECKELAAPVTNVEPLVVARGELLTVDFAQDTPGDLSSGWAKVIGTAPPPREGVQVWNDDQPRSFVSPSGLQIEAPRDPGAYLLGLFAKWDGRGDIMYGFYVEVK